MLVPGLVLAPTLVSCGSDGSAERDDGSPTGQSSLRFLVAEPFWADWNPFGHSSVIAYKINANIFDRLIELRPDLGLEPGLASEWTQVDERTWEFRLRDDVVFHNGQPFTSHDVKASIELASGASGIETVSASNWVPHQAEIVDELTVRLRGEEPFGPLLNALSITDIVSAEDVAAGTEAMAAAPNGTGAYRLVSDTADAKVMEAFEEHYRGAAEVQQLTWEFIQDTQTRVNAVLAGQAQVIDRVEPDQVSMLESSGDVAVASTSSTETQFLQLRTDRPPFDDPRLRQAVAWAIDRAAIVDLVGGSAALATSFWAPYVQDHREQEPAYTRDAGRARALVEESGVTTPLSIELVVSTGFFPKSTEIGEMIKQSLDEVGFDVQLTLLELAAWLDVLLGDEKRGEAFHGGWATIYPDPDRAVSTLYHSATSATGWNDAETDELIETGRATADADERSDIYQRLQAHLWSQVPHLPLMYSDLTDGRVQEVDGLDLYPNFLHKFWPATVG